VGICNSRITRNRMTVLQSFPPEICSLICQDPILERLDLNSICFISHAFRKEAQRELSNHFPVLRGASSVGAWCLTLRSKPHIARYIKGLVLLLPSNFDRIQLSCALYKCVNLKEFVVLSEGQDSSPTPIMMPLFNTNMGYYYQPVPSAAFKLTKFVNGYFSQDSPARRFTRFLRIQPDLESLELHSGKIEVFKSQLSLDRLKTLGCPPQFLDTGYDMTRLRLNFQNSTDDCEIDVLRRVLNRNLNRNMKSLALFLNEEQSHFPEIIRAVAVSHIFIQHLEIHQFLPTQVRP
jgi:hypothetical protein